MLAWDLRTRYPAFATPAYTESETHQCLETGTREHDRAGLAWPHFASIPSLDYLTQLPSRVHSSGSTAVLILEEACATLKLAAGGPRGHLDARFKILALITNALIRTTRIDGRTQKSFRGATVYGTAPARLCND